MLTKEKPIEYTEAAYCAYCADAVFYADNEGKRSASCGIIECLDVTYNRNEEHRERDAEL